MMGGNCGQRLFSTRPNRVCTNASFCVFLFVRPWLLTSVCWLCLAVLRTGLHSRRLPTIFVAARSRCQQFSDAGQHVA